MAFDKRLLCRNRDELMMCLSISFKVVDSLYQIMLSQLAHASLILSLFFFFCEGEPLLKCFAVFPGCVFVVDDDINKPQIEVCKILNQ